MSLAQIVFAMSGGIMPRDLTSTVAALDNLAECGVDIDEHMLTVVSCISIMENLHRSKFNIIPGYRHPSEDANLDDINDLLEQENAVLQQENAQLQTELYEAERKIKQLQKDLEDKDNKHALDRQELIDLRELVYNQQERAYTEEPVTTKITFPQEVPQRIVVFGGHDSWSREIKHKLPNVRFIDRNMQPNAQLIRNADVVWIQPNSISHSNFYPIIDEVRKHNIPLRYFSYASATKCAEQLVAAQAAN